MSIKNIVEELGLQLPDAPDPGGNYSPINMRNGILYVSIQFPKMNGHFLYQGILGKDLTTEDGYKATQICALNVLAQVCRLKKCMQNVLLNHVEVVYRSVENWNDAPKVSDGASDLFLKVLGDNGIHTRSIFGVSHLPKKFSVGVTCSFSLPI